MALPWIVTPTVPQGTDSPGNAPDIFHSLWTLFLDIFNAPGNVAITGNVMSLGPNTDGKLELLPVTKAANPFLRLIGTEPGAADVRTIEEAGVYSIQINRGSEGTPNWQDAWRFGLTTNFAVAFVNVASAFRVYTFPDKSGTLAMLDDLGLPSGTRMLFQQAAAPAGWTRVVNAALTDSVVRIVSNNEVPGSGGTWTITGLVSPAHSHEIPLRQYNGADPLRVDVVNDPFFVASGNTRTLRDVAGSADIGDVVTPTIMSGPQTVTVSNGTIFPIIGVNQGTKTFTIAGNHTADFVVGTTVAVSSSTGNNGNYTVVSLTFSAGNTLIVVVEAIPNATADGNISSPGTWRPKYTDVLIASKN